MNSNKIGSILDKIDSKADIIGTAYGVLQYPMASGRGLVGAPGFMMDAIKNWKPKDPFWVFEHMMSHSLERSQFMSNIMTFAGGYLLAEFGGMLDGRLSKLGRITKKIGITAALGNYLGGFLWWPQFNPAGSVTTGIHTTSPPTGYRSHRSTQQWESVVSR